MNVADVKLVSSCLDLAQPAMQRTTHLIANNKGVSAAAGVVALTTLVAGGLVARQVLKRQALKKQDLKEQAVDTDTPTRSQSDEHSAAEHSAKVFRLESDEDAWKITLEGKGEIQSDFPTKADALEVARELARENQPSELVINTLDGNEQARHAYGVN